MAWNKNAAPRASKEQVTVQIKGGSLTEYTDAGCLVGDVSLGRSYANNATSDENWCVNAAGAVSVEQFIAGAMTGTSSITLEAMLADDVYKSLRGNHGEEFDIKFVLTDGLTPATTETLEYTVVKTGDSLNIRGGVGQTTQFSFDFQINEIVAETIVTAGG